MKRILIGATGVAGLGIGLLLAPGPAQAGHSNALVSAHLTGRACRRPRKRTRQRASQGLRRVPAYGCPVSRPGGR